MIHYRQEKIDNSICYIASEYKKKTRKPIAQMYLYKILARIEFISIRDKGKPVFELTYQAMKKGPVPMELYSERKNLNTPLYKFEQKKELWGEVIYIYAKSKADLNYFSDYELKLMNDSIFILASNSVKTKHASEASHEEIQAWRKAFQKSPNSIMNYADEFTGDLSKKREDELTLAEERFLLWEAMKAMQDE